MAKSKKPATRNKKPATSKAASGAKVATSAAGAAGKVVTSKAETAAAETAKVVEATKEVTSKSATGAADKIKESVKPDTAEKPDAKPADKASPAASTAADTKKPAEKSPAATSSASSSVTTSAPAAPLPVAVPEEKRGSVFLPLVLGGLIAGGIGYAVSEYDLLGTRGQDSAMAEQVAGFAKLLEAQEGRIEMLEEAEPPAAPEIEMPDLGPLNTQLSDLSAQFTAIDTRLTAVEKQPMTEGTSQTAIDAYERELAALQASAAKQRAEIEGLIDNALNVKEATADAARGANVQAALTQVNAAIGSGQPFADALDALGENGVTDVPAALSAAAADGVVTLSNLQTRFPDSARASLTAARASGAGGEEEAGLGGFLKRQLGARSVAPKEGSDPDAVLSRAEAAVRDGQLDAALTEIEGLPDAAKTAMQDWLDDANARQAAAAAAADLSNSLTAN